MRLLRIVTQNGIDCQLHIINDQNPANLNHINKQGASSKINCEIMRTIK